MDRGVSTVSEDGNFGFVGNKVMGISICCVSDQWRIMINYGTLFDLFIYLFYLCTVWFIFVWITLENLTSGQILVNI